MEEINVTAKMAKATTPATSNGDSEHSEVKRWIEEGGGAGILDAPPLEEQDIKTILGYANEGIREFNSIETANNRVAADYAVRNGINLNLLKIKVKENGENWQDFVKGNVVGMSQRTIDKHRKISKIPGVKDHLELGIERLYLLAGAVNGNQSEDPISELFSKHNLEFNTIVEMDFDDFKQKIDAIVIRENLAKANIKIPAETASKIAKQGLPITSETLQKAKDVEAAGGQAKMYFENMLADATKGNTTPGDKGTKTNPPKKVSSFNKAAVQLQQVINEAVKTSDEVVLKDIDASMIDPLIKNLASLKAHLIKH